jgi:hypothetical protein
MENIQTPNILANTGKEMNINFDTKESFEINTNEKNYVLKISLNEKIILFEVEEKNVFPKGDYNIYLSLEELGKINKYFLLFETLKDVLDSLKKLIAKKSLSIIKEEKKMKIKIINPATDKEFFINLPLKEKDLKSEINSLIPYIASLNQRIQILENKLNEIYIYINDLEEIIKERKEKKERKELLKKYEINKSQILNKNEIELFLGWLGNKPSNIKLLLDSRIDGDLTQTFYNKCTGKYPTVVFVKTTKGHRFGGYSSIPWKNLNNSFNKDDKNFIFSLDKQKKYNIKNPQKAIQTNSTYFAFGGGSDFYVANKCTSYTGNYVNNSGTYDTTETYELNGGESTFTVSSYEVYQIEN